MERTPAKSMLKASVVAALVFAVTWIKFPLSAPNFMLIFRTFVGFGFLITLFAMVLGLPLAHLLEKLRIGRWWSYLIVAAVVSALLIAFFAARPFVPHVEASGEMEIENPRGVHLMLTPWARSSPVVIGYASPPVTMRDYYGSIIFGGIVGGVLGLSYWYFRSRPRRNRAEQNA